MNRENFQNENDTIEYPFEEELIFPLWIRSRKDLNWGQKSFLAEIISIDRLSNGNCLYNLKDLAKRFMVTNITILNWTKKLVKLGLLDITSCIADKGEFRRVLKPSVSKKEEK